jgi:hypothetical protein
MSFTMHDVPRPVSSGLYSAARSMISPATLGVMAKGFAVAGAAIAITAGYQLVQEEGRSVINNIRSTRAARKARNDTVLCALLAEDDFPLDIIQFLETRRDAFRAAIQLSLDENVPSEQRSRLREALRNLYRASNGS